MKTTPKQRAEIHDRLARLGVTFEHAAQLRRISVTLQRWAELECGNGNDWASWAIERDEQTGNPYMVTHPHTGKTYRRPVADREKGALKRLAKIMSNYPELLSYHQCDPRGAALYILRKSDVRPGQNIDSIYNRGVAVY
jgi:hypothetical protein